MKIFQFLSKVRSNMHNFLYVVYGNEVASDTRKLNFALNFDIGQKRDYHSKLVQTLYFTVYNIGKSS